MTIPRHSVYSLRALTQHLCFYVFRNYYIAIDYDALCCNRVEVFDAPSTKVSHSRSTTMSIFFGVQGNADSATSEDFHVVENIG